MLPIIYCLCLSYFYSDLILSKCPSCIFQETSNILFVNLLWQVFFLAETRKSSGKTWFMNVLVNFFFFFFFFSFIAEGHSSNKFEIFLSTQGIVFSLCLIFARTLGFSHSKLGISLVLGIPEVLGYRIWGPLSWNYWEILCIYCVSPQTCLFIKYIGRAFLIYHSSDVIAIAYMYFLLFSIFFCLLFRLA